MSDYSKLRLLAFNHDMPLNARIVFSALAAASPMNWSMSINQLTRTTRLAHETVKRALISLEAVGLVVQVKKQWRACEPPEGTLKTFSSNLHWSKNAIYTMVEFFEELSVIQCVLLGYLKTNPDRITKAGLAALFSIDKDTVSDSLQGLCNLGFVDKQAKPLIRAVEAQEIIEVFIKPKQETILKEPLHPKKQYEHNTKFNVDKHEAEQRRIAELQERIEAICKEDELRKRNGSTSPKQAVPENSHVAGHDDGLAANVN